MSYDISFRVRIHNTQSYINLGVCQANTTWNLRTMIKEATGLEWKNDTNNGYCYRIMPKIQKGLDNLTKDPYKYKKFEDPDGWGTVEQCKEFFRWILKDWNQYAEITDSEIVKRTTFWIT